MNRLDGHDELHAALRLLTRLLEARGSWFLREGREGAGLELRRGEWELRVAGGSIVFSYWGESGRRRWRVLAWRVSNSMSTGFCIEAVQEAMERFGTPEIFNTDQGSQFTSAEFVGLLQQHGIRVSMDGKGRWVDNVFVERLWKSVKYEEVYLHAYESIAHARQRLGRYFEFYNQARA